VPPTAAVFSTVLSLIAGTAIGLAATASAARLGTRKDTATGRIASWAKQEDWIDTVASAATGKTKLENFMEETPKSKAN
jgi:hypothetical protein